MKSCAPYLVERSQLRIPRFPSRKACAALAETDHGECCCRAYPGRGAYVLGSCGHAHGWDLRAADAEEQAGRLNQMASREGEGKRVPMTPPSGESAGRGVPAEGPSSEERAVPVASAPTAEVHP